MEYGVENYGAIHLWMTLFIYSKFYEFGDTLLLILGRKPTTFHHTFHHFAACLYCWHAFIAKITPGLWFATLNYGTHMFMYAYFGLMSLKFKFVARFASLITIMQIVQMVWGVGVSIYGLVMINKGVFCNIDPNNIKLAFTMYAIFVYQFSALFYRKYILKLKNPYVGKDQQDREYPEVCEIDSSEKKKL